MVSRARNFASFAKSMEDKTFVSSPISGTTTKTGTINIPLDTEDFTDYQIGQSSTAGQMLDPTTGNVTLTIPQANEANKKFTLHVQVGYDSSSVSDTATYKPDYVPIENAYSSPQRMSKPGTVGGFAFNNDGTRVYWVDYYDDKLQYADLPVPYEFNSLPASPVVSKTINNYTRESADWNGIEIPYLTTVFSTPRDIVFKPDGTKFWVVGSSRDAIQAFGFTGGAAFGTTADVVQLTHPTSSSGYENFYLGTDETNPLSINFKPDGTKMYIGGASGNTIDQYSLSTAWDVTTATRDDQLGSVSSYSDVYGFAFFDSGNTIVIMKQSQRKYDVYDLQVPYDITSTSIPNLNENFVEYWFPILQTFGSSHLSMEPIHRDSFMIGNLQNDLNIITRGNTYSLTFPASVKDTIPYLSRHFRYQIDLSSNNANSGSAEWYITDVRSIRV